MNNRSAVFAMGIMAGAILVLLVLVVTGKQPQVLYAQSATGASSGDIVLATGGAGSGLNDLCWVLKKSPRVDPATGEPELQLALYWFRGSREILFVGSRNITKELNPIILDWASKGFENNPSAKDIKKMVEEAINKRKKEEDEKQKQGGKQ